MKEDLMIIINEQIVEAIKAGDYEEAWKWIDLEHRCKKSVGMRMIAYLSFSAGYGYACVKDGINRFINSFKL